jgi:hypothetical protein
MEEKVLDYFETRSLPEARVLFNVLKGRLAKRENTAKALEAAAAPVKVKAKRTRRTKAQIEAAKALTERSQREAVAEQTDAAAA